MEIPKVGPLPKKAVIPLVVGITAYVGWRFWQSRQASSGDAESTISDGEFGAIDSSVPGVIGAVSPTNQYGSDTGSTGTDTGGTDPTRFTNNQQWTEYVTEKLQQSDNWSYTDIVTAIGNGLAGKPTSDAQQAILRAALAVGGNPPAGAITIVSGGNTPLTVGVSNLHLQSATETVVILSWNPVAGADTYNVYREGQSTNVGTTGTPTITMQGLNPNTTYRFRVTPMTSSHQAGPTSGYVTVKTKATTLGKAATPTVSAITATSARIATKAVSGAHGYLWYVSGRNQLYSESTSFVVTGLKPKTTYTVSVAAFIQQQTPGARSGTATFKTK
jgi:hypothetical protein